MSEIVLHEDSKPLRNKGSALWSERAFDQHPSAIANIACHLLNRERSQAE